MAVLLNLPTGGTGNGQAYRYLGALSTVTIRATDFGGGFATIEAKFSGDDAWTKLSNNSGVSDFTSNVNLNLTLGVGTLIRATFQDSEVATGVNIQISGNISPEPIEGQ